jgi:hypothetical protein
MRFGKASGGSTEATAFVDAWHPNGVAQRVGTIEDRTLIDFCTGVPAGTTATSAHLHLGRGGRQPLPDVEVSKA